MTESFQSLSSQYLGGFKLRRMEAPSAQSSRTQCYFPSCTCSLPFSTRERVLLGTCPCYGSHHGNSLLVKAHGNHPDFCPACTMRQIAQVKLGWDWALKNPRLPIQETQEMQVRSLSQEDPLEEEMATHSSILAWKIPRTGTWRATVHGVAMSQTQLSTQAQQEDGSKRQNSIFA